MTKRGSGTASSRLRAAIRKLLDVDIDVDEVDISGSFECGCESTSDILDVVDALGVSDGLFM